jgi:hypothetical protein
MQMVWQKTQRDDVKMAALPCFFPCGPQAGSCTLVRQKSATTVRHHGEEVTAALEIGPPVICHRVTLVVCYQVSASSFLIPHGLKPILLLAFVYAT